MRKTVALTGAASTLGRDIAAELAAAGHDIVALVRSPVAPGILPAGARVIENWMNAPEALEALRAADAVIHNSGTANPVRGNSFKAAQIETAQRVVDGVSGGACSRLVFISAVGAHGASPNAFLRSKAEAEALLASSGIALTALRAGPFVGAPGQGGHMEDAMISKGGKAVNILGNGDQPMQAVLRSDVAALAVRALDGPAGAFDVVGPEQMTVDELAALLNGDAAPKLVHAAPWFARLLGYLVPDLHPAFVDLMLRGAVGDHRVTEEAFGYRMTSIRSLWTPPGGAG